jgi:hypothetical protein
MEDRVKGLAIKEVQCDEVWGLRWNERENQNPPGHRGRDTWPFSKKWINHNAALAVYLTYYNFSRVHETLRVTPAMKAGITDHIWTLRELLIR